MPRLSEPADDPAVPRANSVACRRCGQPVGYDAPDEAGTVTCACGAATVVEEVDD